jgi:hypothetical protein
VRLPLETLFAFLFIAAKATEIASDKTELVPQVFAPGIISADLDESSESFSPDGKSFYFARRVAYTTSRPISIICAFGLRDGKWTHPEAAPFSGTYLDGSCGRREHCGPRLQLATHT